VQGTQYQFEHRAKGQPGLLLSGPPVQVCGPKVSSACSQLPIQPVGSRTIFWLSFVDLSRVTFVSWPDGPLFLFDRQRGHGDGHLTNLPILGTEALVDGES
jgi:hypothetical protein